MYKKIISLTIAAILCGGCVSVNAAENALVSVTIPYADTNGDTKNDYELEVGTLSSYFVYNYQESTEISYGEGVQEYSFELTSGTNYFCRVTNSYESDAVTYGNYFKAADGADIEVTEDLMRVGDNTFDKNTVVSDFSKNAQDTGDIYLNINEKGSLHLNKGESYNIYPLRNWLAIEGINNSRVIEPDFHYEIINIDGSDVIKIEENKTLTASRHRMELTALNEGTAIVLVSYDSMISGVGMGGTDFSAIWPENTGVFVVSVGGEGFDMGIKLNAGKNTTATKLSGDNIDSEHDVLYYTGTDGAKISFTPPEAADISVLRPTVSNKLTYNGGFVKTGVSTGTDGSVEVSGLIEGSNIIKAEFDGKCEYQVIRAKKINTKISAVRNGEEVTGGVLPGDSVTVKFDTVHHPANKLSGVYNFDTAIQYKGEDKNDIRGEFPISNSPWGEYISGYYQFASNKTRQQIAFTVPENWSGDSYTLSDGHLFTGGFGAPAGAHRGVTYETGKSADFSALLIKPCLGSLPDITVPIAKAMIVSVGSDASVYTVSYNKNGAIESVNIQKVSAGENVIEDLREENSKIFVWNDNMEPVEWSEL